MHLRKAHPAFRMTTAEDLQAKLTFLDIEASNLLAFRLGEYAHGDEWKTILVCYNGGPKPQLIPLESKPWTIVVENQVVDLSGIRTVNASKISVPAYSAMVLYTNE